MFQPKRIGSLMFCGFLLGSFWLGGVGLAEASDYEVYSTNAITNNLVLPGTALSGSTCTELTLSACRGEYEPVSFVIHGDQSISNLTVTSTALTNQQSSIAASAVDISLVKCWYQAGWTLEDANKSILTPELLLKNNNLVSVDYQTKTNYLLTPGTSGNYSYVNISTPDGSNLNNILPKDAKTLQPVDIASNSNQQFWVTVHVPDNAVPGQYQAKIQLTAANATPQDITLKLNVLPFQLEQPAVNYSIYYMGVLDPSGKGTIGHGAKSPQQYLAEMIDLKNHGINNPTFYQTDPVLAQQEIKLREQAGLPKGPMYNVGVSTNNPNTPLALNALKQQVAAWCDLAKANGYTDVYFYGIDEAPMQTAITERAAWQAVHQAGGKVFVAVGSGNDQAYYDNLGNLLDLAVVPFQPDSQLAANFHKLGNKIFNYCNPSVDRVAPETYRKNYGLLLMKANYDGAMNWAYQCGYGSIWDNFDSIMPDQVFAYPTVDGVIDTIAWEGFREGVDDVRYLTTLLKAIQQAKGNNPALAAAAQAWVDNLNLNGDLDVLRADMVAWIMGLDGLGPLDKLPGWNGVAHAPLPSTLILLGSGLLSLWGLRRRVCTG